MTVETLTADLCKPWNADILDDAVMGCLEVSTVVEYLEERGLCWSKANRRLFAQALDAALALGY